MRKLKLLVVSAFLVLILFGSCSTYTPMTVTNSFPANGMYTILGRVTVTAPSGKAAYTLLLEEAKKQFPTCDDIVNIMVDAKKKNIFGSTSYSYEMTAIAIDYK